MISGSSPSSSTEDDPNVNLLLSTLSSSSGSQTSRFQQSSSCSPEDLIMYSSSSPTKRPTFSQIYPTINISNFSSCSQTTPLANSSCSFDATLNPARSLQDHHQKTAAFDNGAGEEKSTSSNNLELKPTQQQATKRPKLESKCPSCPPFKVRKEKLGDKIAALQQLVAPFGKTDTASVLMEAFGYIKFLQNQAETLSLPYLQPSRIKTNNVAIDRGPEKVDGGERKQDLRSLGLCLVPMSCLSFMTDAGGSVWSPPNLGSAT
ncbi:OLC1v1018053C1 [Oldenlandia corymbosa var. corymbosa]|uniref:OLC1v1018053C1 n=1 Tax=Oldenlandia corymbosa var. corymbosa TaxID=529605 RepID=A0AAV1EAY8_OLDCO|nr:OLC1v1018053C1 [Oldenlandia corymbosa var. corymbosa]